MNLDELKKKLLEALPPALREKMGIHLEDEEEEYDDEVDSDEATANHDLAEMGESEEDDEDEDGEDDEEDDEEAQKKAKRSKIIRAVAILAVVFFAADEFLNTEEEVVVPDVPAVMSPAKKALLEAKKKEVEEAKLAAERAALESPEPTAIPTSEPVVIEDPEPIPEPEPEPEVPLETVPEVLTSEDEATPAPTPEAVVTPDFMENIGQTTPSENVPTPQPDQDNSLDALMQAVDKSGKMAEDNMKNQLGRNDPSYVEPPNYLRTGRGLVYNCREGHWACVDKFSYFTCFENQKWNEENTQSAECVTRDVYASGADCAAIQKFYVNKPEPTDFCGKKEVEEIQVESKSEPEDLSNLLAP